MRDFIRIVEEMRLNSLSAYLAGMFYHGNARTKHDRFHDDAVAYLTQDYAVAKEYAEMESSIEGDTPYVLHCRLHVSNPAILDVREMQDLHMFPQRVEELKAEGYDCAVVNVDGHDEICVFGNSKIEVVKVEQISI